MKRITSAMVSRIGLTPCGRLDGGFGLGELDCLQCALRCLHGAQEPSNLDPPTIRDAHVWLFWAGMPANYPGQCRKRLLPPLPPVRPAHHERRRILLKRMPRGM
jgi:hypothetical protein